MIKIFTDTSANLPVSLTDKYNITVLPFSYTVNGKELPADADGEFDGAEFYSAMRGGADIKTSMINPDFISAAFRKCLENGDDVLYRYVGRNKRNGSQRFPGSRGIKRGIPRTLNLRNRYLRRLARRGAHGYKSRRNAE